MLTAHPALGSPLADWAGGSRVSANPSGSMRKLPRDNRPGPDLSGPDEGSSGLSPVDPADGCGDCPAGPPTRVPSPARRFGRRAVKTAAGGPDPGRPGRNG